MKYLAFTVFLFCSVIAHAKDIKVVVDDCGPLARGELGVVFSLAPHGSGKGYFAKGKAMETCPKLVNAKYVVGYEEDYCKNYKPYHPSECGNLKVFVIKEYIVE
jgi:hypothetical protein